MTRRALLGGILAALVAMFRRNPRAIPMRWTGTRWSGSFKAIDSRHFPGYYQLDFPPDCPVRIVVSNEPLIQSTTLSLANGGLIPAWTPEDEAKWKA